MPIDSTINLQNTCDLELFLEVIYSLINWQTSCNWDLLSILVNSPINTQNNDGDLLIEGLPMSICKLEADGDNLYIHRIHEDLPLLLPFYVSPSVLHALVWWNLEESAPCLCSCSQNLKCGDELSLKSAEQEMKYHEAGDVSFPFILVDTALYVWIFLFVTSELATSSELSSKTYVLKLCGWVTLLQVCDCWL